MDTTEQEVYFDEYCCRCKHVNSTEMDTPCWECLEHPTNECSHKPVKWEANRGKRDKKARK